MGVSASSPILTLILLSSKLEWIQACRVNGKGDSGELSYGDTTIL